LKFSRYIWTIKIKIKNFEATFYHWFMKYKCGRSKIKIGSACSAYGEGEMCVQGFGGKTRGKKALGRTRHRWEDNIKAVLQEVGCEGTDWFELAQDRDRWRAFVNAVTNIRVP
jgi:hypothetical protein